MEVDIKVKMGEKTCDGCVASGGVCPVFNDFLGLAAMGQYERCPACLSKYGTKTGTED